jgi:hypothetical protein
VNKLRTASDLKAEKRALVLKALKFVCEMVYKYPEWLSDFNLLENILSGTGA